MKDRRKTIDGGITHRHIPIEGLPTRMTAGKVLVLIATTLAFVLVMSGCSGQAAKVAECKATAADPNGCLFSQADHQLQGIDGVNYEIGKAVGRAFRAGTIDAATKAKAIQLGERVEALLLVARRALATARALSGPVPSSAILQVQAALSDLESLSEAF